MVGDQDAIDQARIAAAAKDEAPKVVTLPPIQKGFLADPFELRE